MLRNFFNSPAIRQTIASTHRLAGRSNLWVFFGVAISNATLQNILEQRAHNHQQIEKKYQHPK